MNPSGARLPASDYLNWGATAGTGGYGLRDNGGSLEWKNSGGVWAAISGFATVASPSFTGPVKDLASNEADFDINEVKSTGIAAGYGLVIVAETSTGKGGVFRLENETISSVSKDASFTVTKDNAATVNVYWETDQVKIQNKVVLGAIEAVSVVAAGADYLVNDILTLADGTAGTVTVATIGGDAHVDSATLSNPGTGYDVAVHPTSYGGAGIDCTVDVTAVDGGDGHIDAWSIGAGGSGYSINDVLSIGGTGTGGTITVTAIDKGHVTGVTVTAPGTGYSVATHTTTPAPPGGTGCTIAVTAIVGLVLKVGYYGIN